MLRYLPALLLSVLLLSLSGCDNVAKAFGSGAAPAPGGDTVTSKIQVPRAAGDAINGRPRVKNVEPKGSAWPTTVPIVVEFSESIYEDSVLPTGATAQDAKVFVRVKGTTQTIPSTYDFVAQGRVLVIRPSAGLSNQQNPTYEVVMLPGGTDIDGVPFSVSGTEQVLAEFECNQAETIHDGRILTTFPRDNQRDAVRETGYYVFFDRPTNPTTVTSTSLFVRPRGGAALAGETTQPLRLLTAEDPRVVRFVPTTPFAAVTHYELVVDDTITFGTDGVLDFSGRTPFAGFDTVHPQAPTAVHVGNPTTGFADKINRANLANLTLHVTTPSDSVIGDRVLARIYGGDHSTTGTGDLAFAERSTTLTAAGAQTVTVDFTGTLGTLAKPKLDDGDVTFCVQMQHGSEHSGFATNNTADAPRFDVTPPTLVTVGPAAAANGTDILTDLEYLAFYGKASEEIAAVDFADGVNPVAHLFGASSDGTFLVKPVPLGRLIAPRPYSLLLTDLAGNLAVAPATGNIVQRGRITGSVGTSMIVDAFDHATLLPIAGATVLLDPAVPTVPATGQLVATTNANGRAVFTGLSGGQHAVTIVKAGYDLVTMYGTGADFLSLPLRPMTNATATIKGNVVFQSVGGTRAIVGNTAFDDPITLGVLTTTSAPNTIPETAIVANRPQLVTAFGGSFEPSATPTFGLVGYAMLGPTLLTPMAPVAPAEGGASTQLTLPIITSTGLLSSIATSTALDFSLATDLDTGNLVGGLPIVRDMLSLNGFPRQVLNGIGFATLQTGASYAANMSYGTLGALGFGAFGPLDGMVVQARDASGRSSRTRLLVTFLGLIGAQPPAIPTITAPSGPFTGSPSVTFADVLDPNPSIGAGIPLAELTATDGAGRKWVLYTVDGDGASGTDTVQFPDLATASVTGLAAGSWSVRAEARFSLTLTSASLTSLVFAEWERQEMTYARSAAVSFTIH